MIKLNISIFNNLSLVFNVGHSIYFYNNFEAEKKRPWFVRRYFLGVPPRWKTDFLISKIFTQLDDIFECESKCLTEYCCFEFEEHRRVIHMKKSPARTIHLQPKSVLWIWYGLKRSTYPFSRLRYIENEFKFVVLYIKETSDQGFKLDYAGTRERAKWFARLD